MEKVRAIIIIVPKCRLTFGFHRECALGAGTYIFKETSTSVKGTWADNKLVEGEFSDKFGNKYTGSFADDKYVSGGSFTLSSSATMVLA